jgi:hypothetical protein
MKGTGMKKYLMIIIFAFFFNSILFSELTRRQLWAISLTGIMTEINKSNRNTLNAGQMNEKNTESWLETLRRDWGINNREELLQTLDKTENNGHAAALKFIQQIVRETINERGQDFSIINIYNKHQLSSRQYNYLKFTVLNWNRFNNRTILAWDLGRNISLCRWGYDTGFLTEDEAWEKIMYYAKKIQLFYNSWEEYGYDYYMGRVFWASGFGDDITYLLQTDPVYKKLMTGYWNNLEWYTKLDPSNHDLNDEPPIRTISYEAPADNDGKLQFCTNDSKYYDKYINHFINDSNEDQNIYQGRVKKVSGHENYGFGILFCADENNKNYYRLFITIEGRFTIQKRTETGWLDPPIKWTTSPYIIKGYNVYNHIRVVRTVNDNIAAFEIYFNDSLAATFVDTTPFGGVKAGLVVSVNTVEKELFPNIPVDIRFDY